MVLHENGLEVVFFGAKALVTQSFCCKQASSRSPVLRNHLIPGTRR